MRNSKKVLLIYTQAKYSVHIHAYINDEGLVCVRKKDTSMPDRYDHVDVLEPSNVRVYREESAEHLYDDAQVIRITPAHYSMVTKFTTRGKAHVSETIISKVANALYDLLKVAKLPLEFTQENLKALYAMGVR